MFIFFHTIVGDIMKNLILIIFVFLVIGCGISNNPTSQVEDLLSKYQKLDSDIPIDYYDFGIDINDYEELVKRQYSNLSYDVKDEVIDGDTASVKVEIEVMDYKSVLDVGSDDLVDNLRNVHDKVTYTIDFIVNKDSNGNWVVDELSDEVKKKLLGIY